MNNVFDLTWMAWTWPTGAFFLAVVLSVVTMGIWEKCSPGGNPRRGVFSIDTTRGDRLFISWLGTGFIHLAWLGLFGPPLWIPLGIAIAWTLFVFRWV
jgi:predicted small integral membrane protein